MCVSWKIILKGTLQLIKLVFHSSKWNWKFHVDYNMIKSQVPYHGMNFEPYIMNSMNFPC